MVDDHDVEDDLRHPESVREGRSRLRPFEEGKHPIDAEDSIQPQGHWTGNLENNFLNATLLPAEYILETSSLSNIYATTILAG